jgi:hypothetical protein
MISFATNRGGPYWHYAQPTFTCRLFALCFFTATLVAVSLDLFFYHRPEAGYSKDALPPLMHQLLFFLEVVDHFAPRWPSMCWYVRGSGVLVFALFVYLYPWTEYHYILSGKQLVVVRATCCSSVAAPPFEVYPMRDLVRWSGSGPGWLSCLQSYTLELIFGSADSTSVTKGVHASAQTPGAVATVGGLAATTSHNKNAVTIKVWDGAAYRSCMGFLTD